MRRKLLFLSLWINQHNGRKSAGIGGFGGTIAGRWSGDSFSRLSKNQCSQPQARGSYFPACTAS